MRVRIILGIALAGALGACSGPVAIDVASGSPAPTATMTVTATATASATTTARATKGTAKRDRRIGQLVANLINASDDDRRPVRQRYLALIRHASFDPKARADGALTLTIDKVRWNDRYHDGGKAEPLLNPTQRWETIRIRAVAAIVVPRAVPQVLTTAEFVDYVNGHAQGLDAEYVYLPPFRFYYVGDRPVAIQEQYIP